MNNFSSQPYPWRHERHDGSKTKFTLQQLHMQQSSTSESPIPSAADVTSNINSMKGVPHHDAHLWFAELLPEGWCVGVCTQPSSASSKDESLLNSTITIHPEEYLWGQNNILSDTSRTSYYLGRMAIRLSLNTLLKNETMEQESDTTDTNKDVFYTQLNEQIEQTAIRKDYYGRPILPEIILGSISHKGEYAVGLSRFCSSRLDELAVNKLQWREECPILDDVVDDDIKIDYDDSTCSVGASSVRGIGIDLERIDGKRGERIQRKILTENELKDLGKLEVRVVIFIICIYSNLYSHIQATHSSLIKAIGISSAEEVTLRFR